jgi:uncharacterized membrane protein (DUF373 family)
MTEIKDPLSRMKKGIRYVERFIIKTLIVLMALLLLMATIELVYTVYKAVVNSREDVFIIDLDNLMNIFGVFLLVVIGIELLDTIKVYFRDHVIHVEVVLLVAVIAIARKIIVMDLEKHAGIEAVGIAALMLAVAGGYLMIKKAGGCGFWGDESGSVKNVVHEEVKTGDGKEILEQKTTVKTTSHEGPSPKERARRINPNIKNLSRNKDKDKGKQE